MKRLNILILVIGLCLLFAFTPDAQAQYYYGVASTSVTATYEDYDHHDNLKFFKETNAISGALYYPGVGDKECNLEIFLDDSSYICIYGTALIDTSQVKTKNKTYKEKFQTIGYGYKYDPGTNTEDLVIMNASGTLIENQDDEVLTIIISGTLSGGNYWKGQGQDVFYAGDYIWTAKFKSTLSWVP
jgi:hypothetical protein